MSLSNGKRFALLSVTDKSNVAAFARGLVELGYILLSTGGTAEVLKAAGLPVVDVADYSGSPEIFGGRVKTLHPKVHGGILFDRDDAAHLSQAHQHGMTPIDLVVVNLYRFKEEAVAHKLSYEEAIEHIDIGGPAMLRAAAKNWQHVVPVISPADYGTVLDALRAGGVPKELRRRLAADTFAAVSAYDRMIADYFLGDEPSSGEAIPSPSRQKKNLEALGDQAELSLRRVMSLRYGENPHQQAALYTVDATAKGFANTRLLQGKELSYNNILDLDAATALVADFRLAAAVIVKHSNPCGAAVGSDSQLVETYKKALACDPKSAFGGIVAFNRTVTAELAKAVIEIFTECVAGPAFTDEALQVFAAKPALRVVEAPFTVQDDKKTSPAVVMRSVQGALLVQTEDLGYKSPAAWRIVTKKKPDQADLDDLEFAVIVAKHVKSNAIVYAKDGVTVGIGAGQMSRIDSAQIAEAKARSEGRTLAGSVLASDAFFPFRDTVDFAAGQGVRAVVQPGGSKRDQDSIDAANEHGLTMVFSGERHFRH